MNPKTQAAWKGLVMKQRLKDMFERDKKEKLFKDEDQNAPKGVKFQEEEEKALIFNFPRITNHFVFILSSRASLSHLLYMYTVRSGCHISLLLPSFLFLHLMCAFSKYICVPTVPFARLMSPLYIVCIFSAYGSILGGFSGWDHNLFSWCAISTYSSSSVYVHCSLHISIVIWSTVYNFYVFFKQVQ